MAVVSLDALAQRRELIETRRRLEDARRRLARADAAIASLRDVLSLLPDRVEVVGADGVVQFANRAAVDALGFDPTGRAWTEALLGGENPGADCPIRRALEAAQASTEVEMRTGTRIERRFIPTTLSDGRRAVVRVTRILDPAATATATPDSTTTDSTTTDPATTDPATTDPAATDPAATDPATPGADGAVHPERSVPRPIAPDDVDAWRDVEVVREIARIAACTTSSERLLARVLPLAARALGADAALFYRRDARARRYVLDAAHADALDLTAPPSLSGEDWRVLERALGGDSPWFTVADVSRPGPLPEPLGDALHRSGAASAVVAVARSPLDAQGIFVCARGTRWIPRGSDDRLLRAVAEIAGAAIERNRLVGTLKRNVSTLVELQRAGMRIAGAADLDAVFDRLGSALVGSLGFVAVRVRITGVDAVADGYQHSWPGPFRAAGRVAERLVEASAQAIERDAIEFVETDETLRLVVDRGPESRLARVRTIVVVPVRVDARCFGVVQAFASSPRDEVLAMKPVVRTLVQHAESALRQALRIDALRRRLDDVTRHGDLASEIVERIDLPVAVASRDGRITLANPALRELVGCDDGELPPVTRLVFSGRVGERVSPRELVEGLFARAPIRQSECHVTRVDGERVPVEMSAMAVGPAGAELLMVFRDVRREAQLRDELLHALALGTAGEHVASLAHQVNNYLTPAFYHAEQLAADGELHRRARRSAQTIQNYLHLCHESIRMVLQIVRPSPPEPLDVNALVEELLERRFVDAVPGGESVVIECSLQRPMPRTVGRRAQLQQALANLLRNAREAIVESGVGSRILVETRATQATITIVVVDDGPGIPEAIRERIFEMGVSGKASGRGTGVGLHFVRDVVRRHRGSIRVESRPGEGTRFEIRLPVRDGDAGGRDSAGRGAGAAGVAGVTGPTNASDAANRAGAVNVASTAATRTDATMDGATDRAPAVRRVGRVLVVDDEPAILELLADMLAPAGHDVITAQSAAEALAHLDRGRIDCIVCDVRMPEIDGRGFVERVARRDADLARRVVFTTGDVFSDDIADFVSKHGIRCVEKPFTASSVLGAIDDVLGSTS